MNERRRRLSAFCWLVVAAVLLRAASGGGDLAGFGYVLRSESRIVLTAGALLLVVALALALARSGTVALSRLSALASIPSILFGAYLILDGHQSGLALAAAAVGALALAAPVALGRSVGLQPSTISRRDAELVDRDR